MIITVPMMLLCTAGWIAYCRTRLIDFNGFEFDDKEAKTMKDERAAEQCSRQILLSTGFIILIVTMQLQRTH